MSIKARVQRLERTRGTGGPCARRFTGIVWHDEPIPPDAPSCRRCGFPHILRIRTRIVNATGARDGPP